MTGLTSLVVTAVLASWTVSADQGTLPQAPTQSATAAQEMFVGITGECHVDSRVNDYIKVYVNGRYRGTMAPFGDIYPFVGDDFNDITVLYAVTTDGRRSWSRTVSRGVGDYHWILVP